MQEDRVLTDRQWLLEARNGDFDAFRLIVNRYSNALLSVAYGVLGDFHEAQDAVQEAWVKAYKNLHALSDPAKLGSWLYSIAYRTSLDFAKRNKRTLPYSEETHAASSDSIHSWLERHSLQEAVNQALQTLEEKSKTAFVLRYLSDWPLREIARFLDLSASAAESRIRRAKEALRRSLAADFEPLFRPFRLGREFEQAVCEQVLKRMGHFYIPVTDKRRTTDWFANHFHLPKNERGNLMLESGQELYLLECASHSPSRMPILSFSVSNAEEAWSRLRSEGIAADPIQSDELFGKLFAFYDPDENKYYAVENK